MKQVIRIMSDEVRNLCIKENYYTRGDNEAYRNLLFTLCKKEDPTVEDIYEIASDIVDHSDTDRLQYECGEELDEIKRNIACNILNECCWISIEF